MTKVKICGITNKADVLEAVKLGADLIGFIFYDRSKRYLDPGIAQDIVNELPPSVGAVGVFVDEEKDEVLRIAADVGIKILQFHGNETPEYCRAFKDGFGVIKAFAIKDADSLKTVNDYDTDLYLFDSFSAHQRGGTGVTFDFRILRDFEILKPFVLSGGLTPENVGSRVKELLPYGVDVSTGVERSPGKKSPELMKRFIDNVRKADL